MFPFVEFLTLHILYGFVCTAIADCMADDETNKQIRETIRLAKGAVGDVVINAQLEKLERTPGNTIREVCVLLDFRSFQRMGYEHCEMSVFA